MNLLFIECAVFDVSDVLRAASRYRVQSEQGQLRATRAVVFRADCSCRLHLVELTSLCAG